MLEKMLAKKAVSSKTWKRRKGNLGEEAELGGKDVEQEERQNGGKLSVTSGVTRTAGSQTPQMEAGLVSAEANYRQKPMEMSAKSEAEEKVLPMEEAVDCSQENEGIKEVTVVKDVQSTGMEGGYVMCEIGGEQQPVSVKAPPQKRRVVIRVESTEAQDYVSGQQGFEELGQEVEELSFVPSAGSEPQWALHSCDDQCREECFKFSQLAAIVTEEGGAAHTINVCKQYHAICWWQIQVPGKGTQRVGASRCRSATG